MRHHGLRLSLLTTSIFLASMFLGACQMHKGPMEKAGERVDDTVDNIKDGDPLFRKKGLGEKAGEKIDNAVHNTKEALD